MHSTCSNAYFLPYQTAWHRDGSRLKICQKSRQIGLSYVDSYDSVVKAALAGGRDVWVMSRDEAQAKQYIRYCKRWAGILQCAASDFGEQVFTTRNGKAAKVQVLTFASGFSIYALSSNPDAIVGKTGHVKLDEFALHKDQRTLYAVAKPVIQWGGTLSVISTHRGIGTVFNEIVSDIRERGNRMGWSLHTIPIQTAVEQGLVEKITASNRAHCADPAGDLPGGPCHCPEAQVPRVLVENETAQCGTRGTRPSGTHATAREDWLERQRAECIDEEQWLQEYCCVPANEAAAFIPYELINTCTEPDCLKDFDYLANCPNPLFLGVDVARKKDLCVLDVGEKVGDVVWDRLRIELLNRPFSEIEEELYRLVKLRQLKRACIDATGLGTQLAERAFERFSWKIEPITFTGRVKEDLAISLKVDLEKRHVRLADDDKLRADLRGIRKEVTVAGNSRYAGECEGSHCDRFWAKALRQHAASYPVCTGTLVA
jgi:phage FluMu gp28-like protein